MDDWWDPTEVVLAVSITTAVLCFILLAINVDRMKLSRNALDLVVVRFKKELVRTTAQVLLHIVRSTETPISSVIMITVFVYRWIVQFNAKHSSVVAVRSYGKHWRRST